MSHAHFTRFDPLAAERGRLLGLARALLASGRAEQAGYVMALYFAEVRRHA